MNKSLKFMPELAELIVNGQKTTTWRLFDDKDLQVDDVLDLINKATLQQFATARITKIVVKKLRELKKEDFEGHEHFLNEEVMYETYKKYYGPEVNPET